MNNIKKAVFYIIFKSKSTIFNMLGVGVLGTLMLVVFQQDQFYSKGTDYLILVFFVVLLGMYSSSGKFYNNRFDSER